MAANEGFRFRVGVRTNTDSAHDFALRGRYKKAAAAMERVIRFRQEFQGPEHRDTLLSWVEHATMVAADGRADEAVRHLEGVLVGALARFGADDPLVADTAYTLKHLYPLIGVHSYGVGSWARIVDEAKMPPRSAELTAFQTWCGYHHAVALYNAGELATARLLLSEKGVLADRDHPVYAAAYELDQAGLAAYGRMSSYARDRAPALADADAGAVSFVAWCTSSTAECADPLGVWADVLEWHVAYKGADSSATLECRFNYARELLLAGRGQQAGAQFESVLERRRATLPPEHPDVLATVVQLADRYGELGRYTEAEALARPALEIYRARVGEDYRDTERLALVLAQALLGQGKTAEAEPLIALLREHGYEIELELEETSSPPSDD